MKKKLVLSLGSNLGNRYAYLIMAIRKIEKSFETPSISNEKKRLWRTRSKFANLKVCFWMVISYNRGPQKIL